MSQPMPQIMSRKKFVSGIVERVLSSFETPGDRSAELITSIILEQVMVPEKQWEADQRAGRVNFPRAARVLESYLNRTLAEIPPASITSDDLMRTVGSIKARSSLSGEDCEHPWDALCAKRKK